MKEAHKYKNSIRRRIILMLFSVSAIIVAVGVSFGYFLAFRLLRDTIEKSRVHMAQLLAVSVAEIFTEEIKDTQIHSDSPFWKKWVIEQDSLYENMPKEAVEKHLTQIDKKWIVAAQGDPLIKEYTDNPLGARLRALARDKAVTAEIFLTDKFGGLVAASQKTTDFYQADEEWWQEAYNNGRGKIFIGKVEFDKSSNLWSIPIAVPVKDDSGEVIGICKNVIDVNHFFLPLEDFKIGRTGHAALIDAEGGILFHRGIKPLSAKFLSNNDLEKLFSSPDKGIITVRPNLANEEGKVFIVYENVVLPDNLKRYISWKVCIGQEEKEAFAPLRTLILQMVFISTLLFLIMMPLGFIFGGIFIRPIKKLHEATERIGAGDLDYKVDIKTGDELEQLADSFNRMSTDLKRTTTSIGFLNREIAERKKAEQALRESQLRYKTLYDSSMDAIMMLIPEKGFISGNPAAIKIFGCEDEAEFTSKTPAELSPKYQPDGEFSVVKAQKVMAIAMEKGSHYFEWTHKRIDGQEFFATVLLTRMDLEGRKVLQATVRDITENKKAEIALLQNRAWLSVTLASIGDGVIATDTKGKIVFINQVAQNLTGWKEEEAKGLALEKVFNILNEDSGNVVENPVVRVLREGEVVLLGNHTLLIAKDGKRFPIDDSAAPIKDKDGNIIGVVLIFRDVTARRKNEEEMRRLASIVESSEDAIIGKGLDGAIITWNKGAQKLYGYTEKEAVGKNISMLLPTGRKDEVREILGRIRKGERVEHFETARIRKDGRQIDVALAISPIYNSTGRVVGASSIARDISAVKYLDRLKDEFIGTVSHELRTPLSITKEGISIVLDGIAGKINEKQDGILKTARDNINRLARIIDSLLDISKIEAGKLELQRRVAGINELIKESVLPFVQRIKAKGLELRLNTPEEEINVYADKDKIIQVFTNLIGNALKFTEKGFIEVGAGKKQGGVECYVLDSGIGISGDDLPKAFSKFEQFGRATGAGEKGTGLGLSIAKGIIEKHRGRIWAESELDKGSKFIFALPVYTRESLFKEHINEGIRDADKKSSPLALIIVSLADFDKIKARLPADKSAAFAKDIEKVFKDSLRREADVVAQDTGEILILLSDCDRAKALIVQGRLEQAWDNYLEAQKFPQGENLVFNSAIYPDDAKSAEELIKKIRA